MSSNLITLIHLTVTGEFSPDALIAEIKKLDAGAQLHHGRNPDVNEELTFVIQWSTTIDINAFKSSLLSGPIHSTISKHTTKTPEIVSFNPSFGANNGLFPTTTSPSTITEIATFYLTPSFTAAQLPDFDAAFSKFTDVAQAQETTLGVTAGHAVGLLENPAMGKEVMAIVGLGGWKSREAHGEFSKSDAFKGAVGPIMPFLSKPETKWVKFDSV